MKQSRENMYSTGGDDQQMNEAMETARKTFVNFDNAFRSGNYDKRTFSIKLRFAHAKGYEHIWATNIWMRNGHYWGIITDTPLTTTKVRLGDSVEIKEQDITDWMYADDTVFHGGYTTRVILNRLPMEEREKVKKESFDDHKIVD
jgi:uncharacterized protein YegJ (DUF2314 family)